MDQDKQNNESTQPEAAAAAPAQEAPATPAPSQVASAASFRDRTRKQQQGEELRLTSGIVVLVRRPSITNLVRTGIVPANVAGSALKFDQGKPMGDRDVKQLFELKQIVTSHALVSPRITESPNYDNNEISIDDLNEDEINDVYTYVQVGLEELSKFRAQRQAALAGSDRKEVSGDQA